MFDGACPGIVIVGVTPDVWPTFEGRVASHIQKMADGSGGRFLAADIVDWCKTGKMQLWLGMDGNEICVAMLTEVLLYPRLKTLRAVGIVGHRPKRWMHLLAHIEHWAKNSLGCDRMEALHQPGHERLLKTGGWRVFHTLSEKVL